MPAPQSPEFEKAIADSSKLKTKPNDSQLLELYGLFKQGKDEGAFADAPKPGTFDFKGKAKYNAWKKVAEEDKLSPADAQKKYVELVEKLKNELGFEG